MATKPKPIQIYPDMQTRARIKKEADLRKWKLGPTVLEIVRMYFANQEAIDRLVEGPKNAMES